jgi:hypothetical protein
MRYCHLGATRSEFKSTHSTTGANMVCDGEVGRAGVIDGGGRISNL